jgi:hypothetical protein
MRAYGIRRQLWIASVSDTSFSSNVFTSAGPFDGGLDEPGKRPSDVYPDFSQ